MKRIGVALALFGLFAQAIAATYPVDDRTTTPYTSNASVTWDNGSAGRSASAALTGTSIVQVRLDLRSWLQRNGRVYLRLQNTTVGSVSAAWSTNGRLLPGSVKSGERALVYSGPIQTDAIEDVLMLTIHADGRRVVRPEQMNFSFEIDVN